MYSPLDHIYHLHSNKAVYMMDYILKLLGVTYMMEH